MREIKFRGKRTDNGEWVYGYLVDRYIFEQNNIIYGYYENGKEALGGFYEVIPETVGQLVFKKGEIEFYEGDIIKQEFFGDKFVGILNYDPIQSQYCLLDSDGFWALIYETIELLGNKYDNPELLKEIFNEMENEN